MKTILTITDEYPPIHGGVANHLRGFLETFANYANVSLLAPKNLSKKIAAPFPVHAAKFSIPKIPYSWLVLIPGVIRRTYDVAADAYLVTHLLPYGTVAMIASYFTRKPYVVMVHGVDLAYSEKDDRKKSMAMRVLGRAALIVANSEYTLARAQALAPSTKGVVVYPCPAIEPEPEKVYKEPMERFALSVGRFVQRKGFRTLLRSVAVVIKKYPDFLIVLVGDGPERKAIEDDIKDLHLEKHVKLKKASDEELAKLYAQCEFFVSPTQSSHGDPEGFGIVFLEANGFGKAVIGGSGGGVNEAVKDKKTGLLIDGHDPNEIAEAIVTLWSDPQYAARLGSTGKARVEETFRYIHTIQPFVDFWNSL